MKLTQTLTGQHLPTTNLRKYGKTREMKHLFPSNLVQKKKGGATYLGKYKQLLYMS